MGYLYANNKEIRREGQNSKQKSLIRTENTSTCVILGKVVQVKNHE